MFIMARFMNDFYQKMQKCYSASMFLVFDNVSEITIFMSQNNSLQTNIYYDHVYMSIDCGVITNKYYFQNNI